MSNETNVEVTTEAPRELKSIDTSNKANVTVEVKAPKPEPKPEVEPKVSGTETPPEGENAPGADSPQGKPKRMPRWMKERLERERQVTEARTREAMLREFQERQPKAEPEKAMPERKTLEDFDFDQDAYTDYLVNKKIEEAETKRRHAAEQKKQAEAAQSFKKRIDDFEERVGDGAWEEIESSPINTDSSYKPLTDLFLGDDHDLDIAHYLATNLKEAERIKGLSRLAQVREIAKIAERFEKPADGVDTPPEAPKKKTTTAPPPVKTVSGAGKGAVDINDPNITPEQRIAMWRKKLKA